MDESTTYALTAAAATAVGPASGFTRTEKVQRPQPDGTVLTEDVTVADPSMWQAAVVETAINLAVMGGEKGGVGKALARIAACENGEGKSGMFVGTVVAVRKEPSTTRAVVTIHTGTTKDDLKDAITKQPLPAGCEQIRTDRTDDPSGIRMAKKVSGMLGHRVMVWKFAEKMANRDGETRIMAHVESLGVDTEAASKGLGML